MLERPVRLALVVSHPIQYAVPLYRRLTRRSDVALKVFFTWHAGGTEIHDRGFARPIAWDIPLTEGYDFELVPNTAADPGTHGFCGLRNPDLFARVTAWQPDVVQITGWAWFSHLALLRALHRRGIRTLFFGDSHLLDGDTGGPRWWLKAALLRRVFSWPSGFLVPGSANRAYLERFGVAAEKLCRFPHTIDVGRFAGSGSSFEQEAARWRSELGIGEQQKVLLYAGKFEPKKRPVDLMRAVARLPDRTIVLVMVGGGELQDEIDALAAAEPSRFRVLPFQNQSRMPIVYRLGDVFVLPSAYDESWGLAVNEALACGRPVIVSDRVGCAADVVDSGCGRIFKWNDWSEFERAVAALTDASAKRTEMGRAASKRAWSFDVAVTEATLVEVLDKIAKRSAIGAANYRPARSMTS